MMSLKQLVMWGLGDQYRVIHPLLADCGYEVVAGVDDTKGSEPSVRFRFPVASNLAELLLALKDAELTSLSFAVVVARPYGMARLGIADVIIGFEMNEASVVATRSYISESATIDTGAQVMPEAIVHVQTQVARQAIINTRAVVEHDCILEPGTEIGPGAVLCGRVTLQRYSWVGAGAVVLPRVTIGTNAIVGAEAVVTRDVPPGAVVAGNPARILPRSNFAAERRSPMELKRAAKQLGWSDRELARDRRPLHSEDPPHEMLRELHGGV